MRNMRGNTFCAFACSVNGSSKIEANLFAAQIIAMIAFATCDIGRVDYRKACFFRLRFICAFRGKAPFGQTLGFQFLRLKRIETIRRSEAWISMQCALHGQCLIVKGRVDGNAPVIIHPTCRQHFLCDITFEILAIDIR